MPTEKIVRLFPLFLLRTGGPAFAVELCDFQRVGVWTSVLAGNNDMSKMPTRKSSPFHKSQG
jgi:hypothetical protein